MGASGESVAAMWPPIDRRRFLREACSLAAGASCLSACSSREGLVVTIHPWVGYETLYLARDFGWLPEGVRLREGKEASEALAALEAGEADAACLTLDEMLRARDTGMPLSAVLVFDVSAGADKVVARPEIGSLRDLEGKRLGLERTALGALVLQKLLEAASLGEPSLTLVDLPPDRQLAAWRAREVDAIITYEPTATLLMREGAVSLFDSRQMPDTIFDVLAVRRDRAKDARLLRALAAAHFRGLEHLRSSPADAILRISAHEGLAPEDVKRTLAEVALPSLAANRTYLQGADSRLVRAARTLSTLMTKRRLLRREDPLDELVIRGALPTDEG